MKEPIENCKECNSTNLLEEGNITKCVDCGAIQSVEPKTCSIERNVCTSCEG